MESPKAEVGTKGILVLLAILLIAYGYYGYFHVPKQQSFAGQSGAVCPLGRGAELWNRGQSQFAGMASQGPCSYSMTSLLVGILILSSVIALKFGLKKEG